VSAFYVTLLNTNQHTMSKTNFYKRIIFGAALFFIGIIILITAQFITQTTHWVWFPIDFLAYSDEISAYGTLVGGILAFLSILFVLYAIYESRSQIEKQRQEKIEDEKEESLNRLRLISNILISTTDDIISQGKAMKIYYEAERDFPSKMNTLLWNTNRHFGRLMNMDFNDMFKAFQTHFNHDKDWNKTLLNHYNLNDFYGDAFADLKQKYRDHIHWKVAEQKKIGYDMDKLVQDSVDAVELYREEHGVATFLTFAWSSLMNDFVLAYHAYLKQVAEAGQVPDYRYMSNEILFPFIEHGMAIRAESGFDKMGSKTAINLAASIRKKINEVEEYSKQYAGDIEKQYNNYFSEDNDSIAHYRTIKEKIDIAIAKAAK